MIKLTLLIFCMVLMQANSQRATTTAMIPQQTTMSPPQTTMSPPPSEFIEQAATTMGPPQAMMNPTWTTMSPPPSEFIEPPYPFPHRFHHGFRPHFRMPRMRCHRHPNRPEWIDARFASALMKAIAINNRYMLSLQRSHSPKLAGAISDNKVLENMLSNAENNLISVPMMGTPAPIMD